MVQLDDFDYTLPPGCIATEPAEPRDRSRLLRVSPQDGSLVDHHFYDLPGLLEPGSLLVFNNAKVIPARLIGRRRTGTALEALLIKELAPGRWAAKIKKAAKLKEGETLEFADGNLTATYQGRYAEGDGILEFSAPDTLFADLERFAHPPLPPYILKARGTASASVQQDRASYQTLFAKNYGSVAAPTAGLHMTQAVLDQIQARGIELAYVTLHVGLGTFEPVRVQELSQHDMHQESFEVSQKAAQQINQAKAQGRKIVALGTTSLRTLESAAKEGQIQAGRQNTQLFIYPPYQFQIVDQLVTNFHLPKSTLLMLVSAFVGREKILTAYQEALIRGYRFFSYGDAMLLG